ncbi:sulfite reductase subunit alpha [Undibacterium sp. Dicai25W]|uniref:sulfite reductase subunit alpha n=1 Tax=Undibacterium sp. Dicai25W TaxID=3413034 RepID=UPI003BF2DC67
MRVFFRSATPLPRIFLTACVVLLLLSMMSLSGLKYAFLQHEGLAQIFITATYACFCAYCFLQHQVRQHQSSQFASQSNQSEPEKHYCIAYASQTGYAAQLAEKTAQYLQQAGMSVEVLTLNQLSLVKLTAQKNILFIVSTTGEGDAPDNADLFTRKILSGAVNLPYLHYAILALGDRHYQHYCAFGLRLEHWLQHHQAKALFDLVDVDNGDEAALRHWQHHLGVLSGHTEIADWNPPIYTAWTLSERHLLNPDSLGAPAFHLRLTPPDLSAQDWQAGDIAEIGPEYVFEAEVSGKQQVHLPHREYSIASIPKDGQLDLLVRQMRRPDGTLGLGSGWLTAHAQIGQAIAVRIRSNPHFQAPADDCPLILIGNGTGIAGLRAHLKARAARGIGTNWLFFCERQQDRDFFFSEEILDWKNGGFLTELNLCFSRDQADRYYVQHALKECAANVWNWVEQDAVILVCGSLKGMAEEVHSSLLEILGTEKLDQLIASHRYRRDVY